MGNPNPKQTICAWSRQKTLQTKYAELPDIEEFNRLVEQIDCFNSDFQNKRAKALISIYYLTAGRVSEVVKTNHLPKRIGYNKMKDKGAIKEDGGIDFKAIKVNPTMISKGMWEYDGDDPKIFHYRLKQNYLGIKKSDINFEEIKGKPFMTLRIENRKNKQKTTKMLPCPIEKEMVLIKHIKNYLNLLSDYQDVLFDFGKKRATQIINQAIGWNPHFIRHLRATHLVTKYDFSTHLLVRFMGWSNSKPAKHYLELRKSDIASEFYKTI